MEIRKSYTRFLSIFFIVALGVAFFSGIQSASPDMRYSGDAYFDENKLMDLKVVGTLGLTEKDVDAIEALDNVAFAQAGYGTDILCGEESEPTVLHVENLSDTFNLLNVTEGRLPEKKGECLLDVQFMEKHGYKIGDEFAFTEDGDGFMAVKELKVVGAGSSPMYISFTRGNTNLGTGEVGGFAYVTDDSFDSDVYTQIYIRARGAESELAYTDAYTDLTEAVEDSLEGIEAIQCQVRYTDVMDEANEKIADARQELEDGKKEAEEKLADAEQELKDAQIKLDDGQKEYDDGVRELADARQELNDGKEALADGKEQYQDGLEQIADARAQLKDKQKELDSSKSQLDDGWRQLDDGQKQLDEKRSEADKNQKELLKKKDELSASIREVEKNQAALQQTQEELDAGQEQLNNAQTKLNDNLAELESSQQELDAGRQQLEEQRQPLQAQLQQIQQGKTQAEQSQTELAGQQVQIQQQTQTLHQQFAQGQITEEQLNAALTPLNAQLVAVEGGLAEIESTLTQLTDSERQVNAGLALILGEIEKLNTAQGVIDEGRREIADGQAQITAEQKKLDDGQKQVDEGKKQIAEAWVQIEDGRKQIEAGQTKLDDGYAQLDEAQKEIDKNSAELVSAQSQFNDGQAQINSAWSEINSNQTDLDDAAAEIAENEQKLADGEKEISENEDKIKDAEKELEDGRKKLADGRKEYEDAKQEVTDTIADGEKKIADAEEELEDLEEPEWVISTRDDLPEYSGYGDNADRIRNIGQVFPVLFFLVAALISLTTMTRMVEEQRTQIGTLKALGYSKGSIAAKYLLYALLATLGGSLLGIMIGEKLLPFIIIRAYGIMYQHMDCLRIPYEIKFAAIASGAALACTMLATLSSCYKELIDTPASLMRPPAPKAGKRVFLERVPIIWKHLNFTWKSTIRNLMRYKKRFFMTVFGIGGCMALLLVGFGLRDSIMDIAVLQYDELQRYDGIIIEEEKASEEEKEELKTYVDEESRIEGWANLHFHKAEAAYEKEKWDLYLYVPENVDAFSEFVTLRDRITHEEYRLGDDGIIIAEKTAKMLDAKVGDTIHLNENGGKGADVVISQICENYMQHYAYMSPKLYEKAFGKSPEYSEILFVAGHDYKETPEIIGRGILKNKAALSISYTTSIKGQLSDMLKALDTVMIVLIISAGMLAFVVLYNLSNINITERKRELATIKVLGFYDIEVSAYVFRENVILTLVGVAAGIFMGILLHRFTIVTVEVDICMFGRNINLFSFVICALFTIGFSASVNALMHFKLKKIDMVESLKSVE